MRYRRDMGEIWATHTEYRRDTIWARAAGAPGLSQALRAAADIDRDAFLLDL